jgi:transcriptional regulator with XRE-family HTH domain
VTAAGTPTATAAEDTVELAELRRLVSSGAARGVREAARLSLSEIAGAIGVSAASVSMWERGKTRPTGAQALRYHRLLLDLDAFQAVPLSSADPIDAAMSVLAGSASELARTVAAGQPTLGMLRDARPYLESVRTVMDWLIRRALEEGDDTEERPSRAALDERYGLPPGGAGAGLGAGWGIGEQQDAPAPGLSDVYLLAFEGDEVEAAYAELSDVTKGLAWLAYRLEWPLMKQPAGPIAQAIHSAVRLFGALHECAPDVRDHPARTRGDCLPPSPAAPRRDVREAVA